MFASKLQSCCQARINPQLVARISASACLGASRDKSGTQCSNVEGFNHVLENFHGSFQTKCVGHHIEVKTSFIFVTKAEFEMYRFNVKFPVYNLKLFACANGGEFVKTALFFNSFSNSRISVLLIRVTLSDQFYLLHLETVTEIARAIFKLNIKCVTPVHRSFFLSLGS